MASRTRHSFTAYPATEARLRRKLKTARIDVDSFRRKIRRCEISHCQGMCCHEGIYLEESEVRELSKIVEEHAPEIRALGIDLPGEIVTREAGHDGSSTSRIALKPRQFSKNVAHYPAHFSDTCCSFLLEDGRCGLQTLGMRSETLHQWRFKPLGCWYFPIYLDEDEEPATLKICAPDDDPYRLPGYPGFISYTECGKEDCGGEPAYQLLRDELDYLGKIAGRDLRGEIERLIIAGRKHG